MSRLPIMLLLGIAMIFAAPPAVGRSFQAGPGAPPPVIEVRLTSFAFTPDTLHLHLGQTQILRLVGARGSHNFSAPALFATSTLDPDSARLARHGVVELREGDVVEIRLTPTRAGTYPIRCTHLFHTGYGMKGEAVVD